MITPEKVEDPKKLQVFGTSTTVRLPKSLFSKPFSFVSNQRLPYKFVDDMAMTWQGMEYGLDKVIDFTMTLLIVQFIQKLSYSKFMAEESKTTVVYDTE